MKKICTAILLLGILLMVACGTKQQNVAPDLPAVAETLQYSLTTDKTKEFPELVKLSNFRRNEVGSRLVNGKSTACDSGDHIVTLVRFTQSLTAEEVRQKLGENNWASASYPVLLHFGIQHPEVQLEKDIVSLQEVVQRNNTAGFPFLASITETPSGGGKQKFTALNTKNTQSKFSNKAWFLAVPKDSPLNCS